MFALLFLPLFAQITAGQQNIFYNPPSPGTPNDFSQNYVWSLGSTQNLTWQTSFLQNMSLTLWQENNTSFEYFLKYVPNPGFYLWKPVATNKIVSSENVFFFQIWDEDDKSQTFSSHYINLTDASTTPSASSAATSSPISTTPTSASSAVTNSLSSTTSTSTSSASAPSILTTSTSVSAEIATTTGTTLPQPSSNGLSSGAKAGLGAGIGIGVFVVATFIVVFLILQNRKLRTASGANNGLQDSKPAHSALPPQGKPIELWGQNEVEMPTNNEAHELYGRT